MQFVMFHGCYHDASGSWPYDPKNCKECLGLPEEVAHTKQALKCVPVGAISGCRTHGLSCCWPTTGVAACVRSTPLHGHALIQLARHSCPALAPSL